MEFYTDRELWQPSIGTFYHALTIQSYYRGHYKRRKMALFKKLPIDIQKYILQYIHFEYHIKYSYVPCLKNIFNRRFHRNVQFMINTIGNLEYGMDEFMPQWDTIVKANDAKRDASKILDYLEANIIPLDNALNNKLVTFHFKL